MSRGMEGVTYIPTAFQDVVALLKSAALAAVEEPLAKKRGLNILYDIGSAGAAYSMAEISVSGMTPAQIEVYLAEHRQALIDFGNRFLGDEEATADEQEYPEGEEQDPDGESETLGLGNGFGIKVVIYHNFLANRTAAELRAYLKNRRIPKHGKFAKALSEAFRDAQP